MPPPSSSSETPMSQRIDLQTITRCLIAAGHAKSPDAKDLYLLYVNPENSQLQLEQWSGTSLKKQALVADSVRPSSSAAYLVTRNDRLVIAISPNSALVAYAYDRDEHEWIEWDDPDYDPLPTFVTHPSGKLAAVVDTNGCIHLVFQSPSLDLTYAYLDKSWSSMTIPVSPVVGSPISISVTGKELHICFISAKDHFIHDVFGVKNSWKDKVLVKQAFGTTVKSFTTAEDEKKGKDFYLLTQDDALLKVDATGRPVKLGRVQMGKFETEMSGDHCADDAWNGTLTEDALKDYLSKDPSCIDTVGGINSVTPLAGACIRGHLEIVNILLRNHANPNALSPKKRTPLFHATSTSEGRDRRAIVRALLEAGANVDECYAESGFNTPLMNAITLISDQGVADELLSHGASTTAKDLAGHNVQTLAQGTPMEGVIVAKSQQENTSPFEAQVVELMVAILMFVVAYSNSKRVKEVVEQIMEQIRIRFKDLKLGNDERASAGPKTSADTNEASNSTQLVRR